jgi:hypothetical protein
MKKLSHEAVSLNTQPHDADESNSLIVGLMMIGTDWTIIGVDEIQLPYYREYGGAHIGLIVVCLFFGV